MAFYFDCSVHKCDCWLEIVNHLDKRDSSVLCTEKKIKSGLKLPVMHGDKGSNIYRQSILRKKLNIGRSIMLFCKFL